MKGFLADILAILSKRERIEVAGLLLLMVAGAWAEMLSIGLIVPFIAMLNDPSIIHSNAALARVYQMVGARSDSHFLLAAALIFLLMIVFKNVLLALLYHAQSRFVFAKEAALSNALLERYLAAPYALHLDRNSTEMIRTLTVEVPRVTNALLQPLLTLASEILVVTMIAALLVYLNPMISLLVAAVMVTTGLVLSRFFQKLLEKYRGKVQIFGAGAQLWATQSLGALKEIRVFHARTYFASQFRRHVEGYVRAYRVFAFLNQMPRLVIETIVVALILSFVAVYISTPRELRDVVPMLAVFALSAIRLMPSATRMLSAVNSLRFSIPATGAVWRDLKLKSDLEPDGRERLDAASASPGGGNDTMLEFSRVSYRHPGMERWILQDVSFTLRRGESVAIVGHSGAGKSTLADLLLGLVRASEGVVRIAADSSAPGRGAAFGYVPQHPYLLDDSLRRNVAFGIPDAAIDDARVWQALEQARFSEQARKLDRGLDTRIGERGVKLSGGERQRISIARTLYVNPDVIVFDEATSSLDPHTEREITDTISGLAGSKTLVVVTHRIAAAARCDRMIFIAHGRIDGVGRYEELFAASAAFRKMVGAKPLEESV